MRSQSSIIDRDSGTLTAYNFMMSSSSSPTVANSSSQSPQRTRTTQTPQSRNPVAVRLYKVLNTKFDDEDTKQALQTLSQLYTSPVKAKEAQFTVALTDEEEEIVGQDIASPGIPSATQFETVPGESAARARKNLRRDMENKLAEGSRKFLEALGEVDSVCARVFEIVHRRRLTCIQSETSRIASSPCSDESEL